MKQRKHNGAKIKYMGVLLAVMLLVCCMPWHAEAKVCSQTGGSVACSIPSDAGTEQAPETKRIVTTVFPVYDWILQLLGDNPGDLSLSFLYDNGVDPHSFQPTAGDLLELADCDLFVYVGGESDNWVEDALRERTNPDMQILRLMDLPGAFWVEEEIEDTSAWVLTPGETQEEPEETEYDEHIWLSLENACICCEKIADCLQSLDPAHAAYYEAHLQDYIGQLQALDEGYRQTVRQADYDTLLFADRFPFLYLIRAYDLSYYAAFEGCSAETEASFATVAFLIQKLDELSLPCVLTIDQGDTRMAATIIRNSRNPDLRILSMNSMQSVSADDVKHGFTYLEGMEQNLEVLKEALFLEG